MPHSKGSAAKQFLVIVSYMLISEPKTLWQHTVEHVHDCQQLASNQKIPVVKLGLVYC